MQLHVLAALFFSTLTLASPVAQESSIGTISSSGSDNPNPIPDVPSSILTVVETAIPASWYEAILDPTSRSSIMSEIQAGTMPAWYNSLPASVKAWATSAGGFANNFIGATPTADAAAGGNSGNDATGTATPVATAAITSGAKAQTTAASTSGSSASETAASTSKSSSSPSSSTSTGGGAPIATGGVAMSFAGAAGLLGLALAL